MVRSNLPHSYQNLPKVDNCSYYAKVYWIQTFSSKFNFCCFFKLWVMLYTQLHPFTILPSCTKLELFIRVVYLYIFLQLWVMLDADSPDRPAAIPSTSKCTKAPRPLKSSHPSIPTFIHSRSLHPDTAPFASSSSATIIPQTRVLLRHPLPTRHPEPEIIGAKIPPLLHLTQARNLSGELSRCLISFIISPLERPLPSAIPAMSDSTPSTDGSV